MDAIQMLEAQHRETSQLLKSLLVESDSDLRCDLLKRVARELTKHTILEETHFYGSVCPRGLEELTHRARHAHEEMKYLLEELGGMEPTDPRFPEKVRALAMSVEAHVHEEETELFPRARANCDAKMLSEIGDAMVFSSRVWEENEPEPVEAPA
jgi:hemerythrin superfamily protein